MKKTLGIIKKNSRGLEYIDFKDYSSDKCVLQQSSLDECPAIWLGALDTNICPMLLNRDQVTLLIKHLNSWLDNNTFKLS